jgi:prephenate dehydratase
MQNCNTGYKGSFHHQVAQEYYKQEMVVDECLSFEEPLIVCFQENQIRQLWQSRNSIAGPIILTMH